MAKYHLRDRALKLRRAGHSITEIAETLSIAKSTASVWCQEVKLTEKQSDALLEKMTRAGHKGRLIGAQKNKSLKIENIKKATDEAGKEIGILSSRDLLLLSLGLYWGEGSKNTDNRFIIVNSDPLVIMTILKWLREYHYIPTTVVTCQIYINEIQKERALDILSFWSKTLKLSTNQFRQHVFIHTPHKKVYSNKNTYMGVLHLYVQKSSKLKYLTMGMLDTIKAQI
jgi:hypothetical protein